MPYVPTNWQDFPNLSTAITAARLNNAEAGILAAYVQGTGTLVNADIAAGAAIAYSKLNLALGIVNGDISASAAIAISKMAGYPSDATKYLKGDGTWATFPSTVTTLTRLSIVPLHPAFSYSAIANVQTSQVANTAQGFAFYLPYQVTVSNFYLACILSGGNYDFGIYDASFATVWRYGSHAVPTASTSTASVVAVTAGTFGSGYGPTTLTIGPGMYYMASVSDSTTPQFAGYSSYVNASSANRTEIAGNATLDAKPLVFQKATSFPLPATMSGFTAWDGFSYGPQILRVVGI